MFNSRMTTIIHVIISGAQIFMVFLIIFCSFSSDCVDPEHCGTMPTGWKYLHDNTFWKNGQVEIIHMSCFKQFSFDCHCVLPVVMFWYMHKRINWHSPHYRSIRFSTHTIKIEQLLYFLGYKTEIFPSKTIPKI